MGGTLSKLGAGLAKPFQTPALDAAGKVMLDDQNNPIMKTTGASVLGGLGKYAGKMQMPGQQQQQQQPGGGQPVNIQMPNQPYIPPPTLMGAQGGMPPNPFYGG